MDCTFIQTESTLLDRNQWLAAHAEAVRPYLRDGRDCTIFTFTRQEPADRAGTRVGGLPYWPQGLPWPVCEGCSRDRPQPLRFTAQLDFRSSVAADRVPGDVLTLHYCVSCAPYSSKEHPNRDLQRERRGLAAPLPEGMVYAPGGSALTWHRVSPEHRLISATDLPHVEGAQAWETAPYYGTASLACDYPTPDEAYGGGIAGESYTFLAFTLQGTKIGGYPPPIQALDVPLDSAGSPMHFLAALGSLTSRAVDRSDACASDQDFLWGDMGSLFIWMSGDLSHPEMAWYQSGY